MEFFKPEDFKSDNPAEYPTRESIAKQANAKLAMAMGPMVYGKRDNHIGDFKFYEFYQDRYIDATHQAYLFQIEEIPKRCEKHEPIHIYSNMSGSEPIETKCKHCGVELIAEWREK